ncbi:DUF2202 domain-containing protein [Candidatus Bipolaricaulota sp. J31]
MKSWKKLAAKVVLGAVLAGALFLPALAYQGPPTGDTGDVNVGGLAAALEAIPPQPISGDEVMGILYMREEEKLALDVYTYLYEKWGLPIFANIAASEKTHVAAMGLLIERYNLEDPMSDEPGVFTNQELQELYDELVARGSESLVEALKVGALIEEVDIVDIQGYLEKVNNEDIKLVYENLLKGSRNHLRAFVATLESYGVTYEPQVLSPEAYQEIVSTPTERGRGG